MIAIKTVVTVSQDDPRIDEYKEKLIEPEWKQTETSAQVIFVRVQYYGTKEEA